VRDPGPQPAEIFGGGGEGQNDCNLCLTTKIVLTFSQCFWGNCPVPRWFGSGTSRTYKKGVQEAHRTRDR